MLIAGCSIMFASCIDNDESDSVKQMREAKASEYEAMAAYLNAQAQAALIAAQAEANYIAAQAQVEAAKAQYILAQAAYQEALALIAQLEAQIKEGSVSAEIEAALQKAQADAAEHAARLAQAEYQLKQWEYNLEVLAMNHEAELLKAELEYEKAMIALKAYIAEIKAGTNEYVADLLDLYEELVTELAGKELEAVQKSLEIMQAEAKLAYYTETQAMDKEKFIKDLESAVTLAEKNLANARESLETWEALLPDVESAYEKVAALEAEIEVLKKQRITAYNEYQAAFEDRRVKEEEKDRLLTAKNNGFTYNYYLGNTWYVRLSNDYVSLANGETYRIEGTVEGVRSIIPLVEADIVSLEADYEKAVADYNTAIAGIEDAVEADQQAYENYIAAAEAWITAWDEYNDGDITKSQFLAVDEAYCIAYVEYFGGANLPGYGVIGGTADGRQSRPNGTEEHDGTKQLVLGILTGVYSNTTNYPGDPSDQDLIDALASARTAWLEADAAYRNWELTADDFLAVDEAYCIAYAELNGGVADGSWELRPDGTSSFSILDYAMYVDADTYEGTRYLYGDLIDSIEPLRSQMEYCETAVAKYQETLASLIELEEVYEEYDEAYAEYVAADEVFYEKYIAYEEIRSEIIAKNRLLEDLYLVQTVLAGESAPYALTVFEIENRIATYTANVEQAEADLAQAELDYAYYEELWVSNNLTYSQMLEYMAAQIEEQKALLALLNDQIEMLQKQVESLKASIDELLD
ncbi:MAG: hypothetical protein LIO85_07780 [Rikenellaceae bacterium]|nr:hypothetical protein [Rikenellaceae bacterium]